jgi:hypothetical protein
MAATVERSAAAWAESLNLIPYPKAVEWHGGQCALDQPLEFEAPAEQGEVLGRLLNEELQSADLKPARLSTLKAALPVFRLSTTRAVLTLPAFPASNAPEAYALEVRAGEVVGVARTPAGLVCALQTLRQLIRANRQGAALPCLWMRDWPTLRWRAFQDDLTRGPSSTLGTLKFEADLASFLKLNLMTFYMEYQFAFQKHPRIGPTNGSLTAAELSSLVTYAKPLNLDILGNQQSFGHFGWILRHPEYAHLRETSDVLTPVREETYQLLDDLYSEVCPLLPFPWFNVCCDETYGLGTGPSKDLAKEIGVGGVYVRHIRRVHDLLQSRHGKRMLMWGDILLQHPQHLEQVPKDTIMLTWGYDARRSFEDQILPFAKSGYEFFVCPGVNNWSRILPDFGVAVTNIQHFVRDGVKLGALGMLNTDWEDDGEALNAVKWHADAWAAECAWNGARTPIEVFNRRVGAVLFGESGDHFGRAIERLAQTHRQPAMKGLFNARFWQNDFVPKSNPAAIESAASHLLAVVRPALAHLAACRREARHNAPVLDALEFGARRLERMGQRQLDGLTAAQLYQSAYDAAARSQDANVRARVNESLARVEELIQQNRSALEALGRDFARVWLRESKPYALDWTLIRYTNAANEFTALARKIADAQSAFAQGRPLPPPDAVGLALPAPLSRRWPARAALPTPLAPGLPWQEPSATHRMGLTIEAGAADRFDLPLEVELTVPESLAGKAVRAFQIQDSPREWLAQLDLPSQSGKPRLVMIVPGPLRQGAEVSVHLYLGLTSAPPVLAEAVTTRSGDAGRHWIENNQVRLLLGPEGAHVYRWEVKAAGQRDLTMPGETGWAGFSDLATHRHARYRLDCTARGPALVEFVCATPDGHTKTIRLHGGASWMEVFLSEPTPVYWDFDDPKNFAADGPTPGTWLFSSGHTGPVGREANGVPAQVKADNVTWGIKFGPNRLALGLATPGTAARHLVAPGSSAGGVGIESSPPARHFVTYAGLLETSPAETMNRLQATLDLQRPVRVRLHGLQAR